jgi:hypothetical protein
VHLSGELLVFFSAWFLMFMIKRIIFSIGLIDDRSKSIGANAQIGQLSSRITHSLIFATVAIVDQRRACSQFTISLVNPQDCARLG